MGGLFGHHHRSDELRPHHEALCPLHGAQRHRDRHHRYRRGRRSALRVGRLALFPGRCSQGAGQREPDLARQAQPQWRCNGKVAGYRAAGRRGRLCHRARKRPGGGVGPDRPRLHHLRLSRYRREGCTARTRHRSPLRWRHRLHPPLGHVGDDRHTQPRVRLRPEKRQGHRQWHAYGRSRRGQCISGRHSHAAFRWGRGHCLLRRWQKPVLRRPSRRQGRAALHQSRYLAIGHRWRRADEPDSRERGNRCAAHAFAGRPVSCLCRDGAAQVRIGPAGGPTARPQDREGRAAYAKMGSIGGVARLDTRFALVDRHRAGHARHAGFPNRSAHRRGDRA